MHISNPKLYRLPHHREYDYPYTIPIPGRILDRVAERTFREAGGCHFYNVHLGNRLNDYPAVEWHIKKQQHRILLSRLALTVALDRPIMPGKFALHRCNDARCINGAHIYEGTTQQNRLDRVRLEAELKAADLPLRFIRPRPELSALERGVPSARRAAA